jgi:predicted metalloprotease with PDZ domain
VWRWRILLLVALASVVPAAARAQSSSYRLSFADAGRHAMHVELTLADVPPGPLELHMSAASPGRYAAHDFARGVSDVEAYDASGERLRLTSPGPRRWIVPEHGGRVRVSYRVAGDRIDGTYLAIDATHAHVNMPAALLWARGFETGAMTVRFEPPSSTPWRVATQLYPGPDAWTFTAPNLQYLMDSPTELSAFTLRTFTVADGAASPVFRVAVHHQGQDADVDALAAGAEKIVREARDVFGEFPAFDVGAYTFIADYLPTAHADGMEHRNSTILTSPDGIRDHLSRMLDAMAHEFFHAWNVERLRPRTLEPFDFDAPNQTGELWLAEGFTEYYGSLVQARAGLISASDFAAGMGALVGQVLASPARRVGTLEDMSRLATTIDTGLGGVPPQLRGRFLSYYTWGGAVALALDLSLRQRSNDRVTLDDFMRLLWTRFGRPVSRTPGLVARPYTEDDVKAALAEITGDRRFAADFFARYIEGHDVADYARLLGRAGFVLRRAGPGDGTEPRMDVVLAERAGRTLTPAQRRVRAAWLGSRADQP